MSSDRMLNKIRLTAAEILAAAVSDYAFKTYKVRGDVTPWGFYYDFIFVTPFSDEMLPLVEERMRQITAKNTELKMHEMIPKNAVDYLLHHRRPYAAHFAKVCRAQLTQVLQMGDFVDHVHGECLANSGELSHFRLLGMEKRPPLTFKGDKKTVHRIYGTAFADKDSLKKFMRDKENRLGSSHQAIGEKLGLFSLELTRSAEYFERAGIYWTGEGEKLLHGLKEFWRKAHLKEGFELVQTSGKSVIESHQKFYEVTKRGRIAEMRPPAPGGEMNPIEGLLSAQNMHEDTVHIFCSKNQLNEKIISSLKFLGEIPTMFQLKSTPFATATTPFREALKETYKGEIQEGKETKVEWMIEDGFGHLWKGPYLKIKEYGKNCLIEQSAFYSVERMIALILETQEKDLSQKKDILSKLVGL